MVDIRTNSEIKRDERHKKICDWWKQNYDADRGTRNRFLEVGARTFGITREGFKQILIKHNLYSVD